MLHGEPQERTIWKPPGFISKREGITLDLLGTAESARASATNCNTKKTALLAWRPANGSEAPGPEVANHVIGGRLVTMIV